MSPVSQYDKINNVCLVILASVAVTSTLIYTKGILVPFVIAFFIFAIMSPIFEYFRTRLKLPTFVALAITTLCAVFVISVIVFFLVTSFENFLQSADSYRQQVIKFVQWAIRTADRFGYTIDDTFFISEFKNLPLLSWAKDITGGVFHLIANTFLILIFTLFMLMGEKASNVQNPIVQEIHNKISRYSATKLLTSVTTGVLVGIILWICQVDLALMFAVLTILLNFIPSFGSIIATLLPLPVILLQFGLGAEFIAVLVGCGSVQVAIGNVIEPKMMGESMDLHPIVIMIFLMFWGLVWGIPGMFLAVPITAILKIVLSRIETTKSFSELLAGRFS